MEIRTQSKSGQFVTKEREDKALKSTKRKSVIPLMFQIILNRIIVEIEWSVRKYIM